MSVFTEDVRMFLVSPRAYTRVSHHTGCVCPCCERTPNPGPEWSHDRIPSYTLRTSARQNTDIQETWYCREGGCVSVRHVTK